MNLVNDPLFYDTCKHIILKNQFIEDYEFKTAPFSPEAFLFDFELDDWENDQKKEINKAFFDLIDELNSNKTFYFGCPFINYSLNFESRLSDFLKIYVDATIEDFIISELDFLENIAYDLEDLNGAYNGFNKSSMDIIKKGTSIVSMIGQKQYNFSSVKKIKFLKVKKTELSNSNGISYNQILKNVKTPEINELLINIVHNNMSLFSAINKINSFTTPQTYKLFLAEFNECYNHLICDFMFCCDISEIEVALDYNKNRLDYVYIDNKDLPDLNMFIRDIGNHKTIFNVFDLSRVENKNSTKAVYLNDLMINYCDGFLTKRKIGFEYLISLKKIYEHLNSVYLKKNEGESTKKNSILLDYKKSVFIRKITEAEKLAEETFEISVNQDLFAIERQKINEEHHNNLMLKYHTDTINNYNSTVNLYKASNDQFAFLNNEANDKLTDEDRIDFIATVLLGYLNDIDDKNNNYDDVETKEIFSQLKNIDTLIYETKLLELKAVIIKKYLNETENELKENDNSLIENKNILVEETENDHLKSTIEDYLEEFAMEIKQNGYEILVDALYQYFKFDKFPILKSKIYFKRINKKRVGWALKKLYQSEKIDDLPIEYFRFAQENINLFENEIIESDNFKKSNLYKFFTTNPIK